MLDMIAGPTEVLNLEGMARLFSVDLTWNEPAQPNGVIGSYTIQYSVNGSSLMSDMSTTTMFTISGLNPNTVVSNITVFATTGGGDSPLMRIQEPITTLDAPGE